MPENKQYSTAQVAQRYQVDPRTVRRWIDVGYFPNAVKLSPAQRLAHPRSRRRDL